MYEMIHLNTPLADSIVKRLRVGDVVYLSGLVYTARDCAHNRALSLGFFPEDIRGGVIFHAGPVVRKTDGRWYVVSIGPTTSSRMNSLEPDFIKRFGIKGIIGKGGMDSKVVEALKKNRGVYFSMVGGCAASAADKVSRIAGVHWLDLGMPEAVWILEVNSFGPLVVAIDSYGRSLYDIIGEQVKEKLRFLLPKKYS